MLNGLYLIFRSLHNTKKVEKFLCALDKPLKNQAKIDDLEMFSEIFHQKRISRPQVWYVLELNSLFKKTKYRSAKNLYRILAPKEGLFGYL